MNLEDIIRAWKSDEQPLDPHLPANPLGRELSEEELLEIFGSSRIDGFSPCPFSCEGGAGCSIVDRD